MYSFSQLGRIYFGVMQKKADELDSHISSGVKSHGLFNKYLQFVSPRAWHGEWDIQEAGDQLAWWCGVRAIEIEMRDKLINLSQKFGFALPDYPTPAPLPPCDKFCRIRLSPQ